ncbi:hypothetical protein AM593_00010, partial [Mytilus galloprovincialis]
LEPEQMTRQSKTRRRSSKDLSEEASREAPKEFEVMEPGKSLWNSEFKNLKDVVLTKAHNEKADTVNLLPQKNVIIKNDNSPEEINYAFNRDSFIETDEQKGGNDGSPSRKPLLKGDSQESYSSGKSQLYEPPAQSIDHEDRLDGRTNDKSHLVSNVDYEDTELIAVDMNKGSYSLNDSHGSMSSLNLQKTGFDFLDEWRLDDTAISQQIPLSVKQKDCKSGDCAVILICYNVSVYIHNKYFNKHKLKQ